jgi:NDP-sugar pyrophosphorylase family protein
MLLAAGRGERMEPLSSLLAKPALEVLGRPLLASAWRHLCKSGCRSIVVNLHRHPEQVAAAVREVAVGAPPLPLFSREAELLGSAGGIAAARPLLGPSPVLVANADVWAGLDLAPVMAAGVPEVAVLALLPHPDPARWSSLALDERGRVERILAPGAVGSGERFLFTGFQWLGEDVVAALPAPPGQMQVVWERLREEGRLLGVIVRGTWREAGSPASYRELVVGELAGKSWVHPQATVAAAAVLVRSAVGAGCTVADGASVEDSVLTAGASVRTGCVLSRCVVAGPVTLANIGTASDTLFLPSDRHPLR